MLELTAAALKEEAKEKMTKATSFKEISKKMSPDTLLETGDKYGLFADIQEIEHIKNSLNIQRILPREGGEWSGEVGNSVWKPNFDEIPKRPPGNEKSWGQILSPYKQEGITFKNGEVDFSPFSKGTVKINNFSPIRPLNYTQADENLAKQWSKDGKEWSPHDVKVYRKENNLTWHERSDMRTMDLVPQEIHGNIPHSGGISVLKNIIAQGEQ